MLLLLHIIGWIVDLWPVFVWLLALESDLLLNVLDAVLTVIDGL